MSRTDDREATARDRGERVPACPACGARARRDGARFCSTCGRSLRERGYRPADGLRASYRWQTAAELSRRSRDGGAGPRGFARSSERPSPAPRPRADENSRRSRDEVARPRPDGDSRRVRLTSANRRPRAARRNGPTEHAYVLLAYALMPCVGVFFCPAAAACGAAGLRRARRERHPAAEREAEQSIVYAILLFGAQALLWGFMFLVPVWFG